MSDCDLLSPDAGVSLASSSSRNCSISALAAASSAWGFEAVAVSLSEVFAGPAAALLAAVFRGMVAGVVVIPGKNFLGVWSVCPVGPWVLFCSWSWFCPGSVGV